MRLALPLIEASLAAAAAANAAVVTDDIATATNSAAAASATGATAAIDAAAANGAVAHNSDAAGGIDTSDEQPLAHKLGNEDVTAILNDMVPVVSAPQGPERVPLAGPRLRGAPQGPERVPLAGLAAASTTGATAAISAAAANGAVAHSSDATGGVDTSDEQPLANRLGDEDVTAILADMVPVVSAPQRPERVPVASSSLRGRVEINTAEPATVARSKTAKAAPFQEADLALLAQQRALDSEQALLGVVLLGASRVSPWLVAASRDEAFSASHGAAVCGWQPDNEVDGVSGAPAPKRRGDPAPFHLLVDLQARWFDRTPGESPHLQRQVHTRCRPWQSQASRRWVLQVAQPPRLLVLQRRAPSLRHTGRLSNPRGVLPF
jgi:hypothetical protein